MRLTFRKDKKEPYFAQTITIKVDGECVGTIQQTRGHWFWYGDGQNTWASPATLEQCKAEIRCHFEKKFRAIGAELREDGR